MISLPWADHNVRFYLDPSTGNPILSDTALRKTMCDRSMSSRCGDRLGKRSWLIAEGCVCMLSWSLALAGIARLNGCGRK
jgi:hypothetical protein